MAKQDATWTPTQHCATFAVLRADGLRVGSLARHADGWRFFPATSARKPSRKTHATAAEALLPYRIRLTNGEPAADAA